MYTRENTFDLHLTKSYCDCEILASQTKRHVPSVNKAEL